MKSMKINEFFAGTKYKFSGIIIMIFLMILTTAFSQENRNALIHFPVLQGEYLGQKPPGMKPELFAPGIINTDAQEMCISFAPGAKELYFVRRRGVNRAIFTMKEENGQWTPPQIVHFSGEYDDAEFTLSSNGKKLVFISLRPRVKSGKPLREFDIWISEKINQEWGEPYHLGFPVNSEEREVYPALSQNGDLYFGSNRDGTWDIYVAKFFGGEYGIPEKLNSAINSNFMEWDQALAPDDSYMVFCSVSRPDGYGKSDLYVSFCNVDVTWTNAKNMGESVNTSNGMICPSITPDGKYLFFNTILKGKRGIYWISTDIIDKLK